MTVPFTKSGSTFEGKGSKNSKHLWSHRYNTDGSGWKSKVFLVTYTQSAHV